MFSFWSLRDILMQNNEAKQQERYLRQFRPMHSATINSLPDEMLVKIFNYLNFRDRCVCERVCRRFQKLCYYGVKSLIVSAHEEDKIFTFFNTCNVVIIPRVELFFFIIRKVGRYIENLKVYGFQLKKKWLPANKRDAHSFVDVISEHCKNLKYLSIRKVKNLDERSLSELLERIGPLTGFSYDGLIVEETFVSVIDKLNPHKLTDLTCLIENSKVLSMICDKFIKLKNLNMSFYKDVTLSDLDKLELVQCSITNHHLKATTLVSLFTSDFNHNLRFLGLECVQVDSSVVNTLSKFKKLETLKILLSKQDELDTICKSVPSLKRLVLSLTIYPQVNEIRSIKYLKNLRSLEIKCRVVQKLKFEKIVIPNLKHLNLNGASYFNEKSIHNFHSTLATNFPNLITLRYKDTNQLNSSFFKMLDDMKRLKLLVVFLEQTTDLSKTINRLRSYTQTMTIDLILCKKKSELNNYFFTDIRPLHYLEPKRSYNLPKTINVDRLFQNYFLYQNDSPIVEGKNLCPSNIFCILKKVIKNRMILIVLMNRSRSVQNSLNRLKFIK